MNAARAAAAAAAADDMASFVDKHLRRSSRRRCIYIQTNTTVIDIATFVARAGPTVYQAS